ncbi:Structural maintenance of chromosomes 3 [Brachionus plicatilis]|uniref:Tetraspanin n=1 Tax=Brachionus plicatilis TaxID=10195 RepID=A0A3M7QEZ4_BRAPC|nr:Structural maintenance of chromosomes 3 [Brachionus plicatilis]
MILAVGSIVGGSWLLYQRDNVEETKTNYESVFDMTTDLGAYLIAIGVLGIIFSVIGLAATIRENIFFLRIYLFVLILILVLNLVIGVIFLIYSGKITSTVIDKMQTTYLLNYYDDDELKSLFDLLQGLYSCCGIQGYKDWESNPYHTCNSTKSSLACLVPVSCCKDYQTNKERINLFCSQDVLRDETKLTRINTEGCRQAIISLAQLGINALSGGLVGVSLILGATVIMAQYLLILIRKEKALFNAKNRYLILDNNDETFDYLN